MKLKKISILFVIVCLISCAQNQKNEDKGWNESMKEFSAAISDLLPSIYVKSEDVTGEQKDNIKALTKKLSTISHGIDATTAVPSMDPSLKFVTREFKAEITQIQFLIEQGQWKTARYHLKSATQYCIACHTMTASASSDYALNLKPNLRGFSEYDKATYFTAVRQFDQALIEYEKALTDLKWANANKDKWNQGIMSLLAITTRVKNNPNLATEMISRFFDAQSYPQELNEVARIWRQHTVDWNNEKSKPYNLSEVDRLIKKSNQHQDIIYSDMILNLRISSVLNELLKTGLLTGTNEQKALYYSGVIARKLEDLNFSGFPRDYFQLCVEKGLKTQWGKKCKAELGVTIAE